MGQQSIPGGAGGPITEPEGAGPDAPEEGDPNAERMDDLAPSDRDGAAAVDPSSPKGNGAEDANR